MRVTMVGAAVAMMLVAGVSACGPRAAAPDRTGGARHSGTTGANRSAGTSTPPRVASGTDIPHDCTAQLRATRDAFGLPATPQTYYNDPGTHHFPHDMAAYMRQDVGTYPGLECAISGVDSDSPISLGDLSIRPYDQWWADNIVLTPPVPGHQCADLAIAGQQHGQGCWFTSGDSLTYDVTLTTGRLIVTGEFSLYQAPQDLQELRTALHTDLSQIVAAQ